MEEKNKEISELDAQLRLMQILNDSYKTIKLGGREFQLRPLRQGAQWLICEEACKIAKAGEALVDIIKQFAVNAPAVVRCVCIAILNDKDKIEGKEYDDLFDYLKWEVPIRECLDVLIDVLQMLDYNFFWTSCEVISSFRQRMKSQKAQQR